MPPSLFNALLLSGVGALRLEVVRSTIVRPLFPPPVALWSRQRTQNMHMLITMLILPQQRLPASARPLAQGKKRMQEAFGKLFLTDATLHRTEINQHTSLFSSSTMSLYRTWSSDAKPFLRWQQPSQCWIQYMGYGQQYSRASMDMALNPLGAAGHTTNGREIVSHNRTGEGSMSSTTTIETPPQLGEYKKDRHLISISRNISHHTSEVFVGRIHTWMRSC